MIRTQIQLPEREFERLRAEAARQRRSMADCIREGIDLFLRKVASKPDDLSEIAGKFRPRGTGDLKPHDRWFVEAAGKGRAKRKRRA